MGIEVKVKFFASGRELAGTDGLVLQLPDGDSNTDAVTRVRSVHPVIVKCGYISRGPACGPNVHLSA